MYEEEFAAEKFNTLVTFFNTLKDLSDTNHAEDLLYVQLKTADLFIYSPPLLIFLFDSSYVRDSSPLGCVTMRVGPNTSKDRGAFIFIDKQFKKTTYPRRYRHHPPKHTV